MLRRSRRGSRLRGVQRRQVGACTPCNPGGGGKGSERAIVELFGRPLVLDRFFPRFRFVMRRSRRGDRLWGVQGQQVRGRGLCFSCWDIHVHVWRGRELSMQR